ncbi:MAG: N-acetylglucosamine-6-phosphate deacetylase [Eubacteriales bacterium]
MAVTVLKNTMVGETLTDLILKDGLIAEIGRTDAPGRDMGGLRVFPGLIDIHCHGHVGEDATDGGDLSKAARFLYQNGTTTWLPTTTTASFDALERATSALPPKLADGAEMPGFHVEGPYLSQAYKGAQNPDYLKYPDLKEFSRLRHVRLVTVAPELPGAMDFIAACPALVCLGHTACTYEEGLAAFRAGAVCVTHTCNAMPPLQHREPSLIGAAITANAYVQVICDGIHIHPAMITALYRIFGPSRMILISDAIRAAGLPDGSYQMGGQEFILKEGVARVPAGNLAGSTATLLHCVQKAISFGIPAADAFRMASQTPAEMLGINRGRIAVGYVADLLFVNERYELAEVYRQR